MRDNIKMYFIALTGAKKNVGDYLITDRALTLLHTVAPEYDYIKYPIWKPFNDLNFVNKSKGIIILGGPGFQMDMYPQVYKLSLNLHSIEVPIYILGSGWKGVPGDATTEKLYRFSDSSKTLLDRMEKTHAGISCRDQKTWRVLKNNGYRNVTMTGCPVWYDIPSLNKEFMIPESIQKIIFTPAQNPAYADQSMAVMRLIKNTYPHAHVTVSFHRGIGKDDEYTPESDAANTKNLAGAAEALGFEAVDVSYDADKLYIYDTYDLHIGYRVHGHLYFLSKRLPSVLIHEDGRGNGVTELLKTPGVNAYRVSPIYASAFGMFRTNGFMAKAYSRIGYRQNKTLLVELTAVLDRLTATGYAEYRDTKDIIDGHYAVMKAFIQKMVHGEVAQ